MIGLNREVIQYVVGFLPRRSAANSEADARYKVKVTTGILNSSRCLIVVLTRGLVAGYGAAAGSEGIRTHPVSYRQAQRDSRLAMQIRRLSCL